MELVPIEVYSHQSNAAVMRAPGRHYPGVLVQGDTLSRFCAAAGFVGKALAGSTQEEEALGEMQELLDELVGLLMHYQRVLDEHGIELPFERRTPADFPIVYEWPDDDP